MIASPLLVSGCAGDTRRYRAWHAAEAMALAGRPIRVRTVEADPPTADELAGAPVLILHRVAWHPDVDGWIGAVRAGGGTVLYDTDDLVFDAGGVDGDAAAEGGAAGGAGDGRPDIVPHADAARSLAPPAHHRRVLTACDGCVVSTAPLAVAVERLGVPAWVVPNAIDLELWRLSGDALARRARRRGSRPCRRGSHRRTRPSRWRRSARRRRRPRTTSARSWPRRTRRRRRAAQG